VVSRERTNPVFPSPPSDFENTYSPRFRVLFPPQSTARALVLGVGADGIVCGVFGPHVGGRMGPVSGCFHFRPHSSGVSVMVASPSKPERGLPFTNLAIQTDWVHQPLTPDPRPPPEKLDQPHPPRWISSLPPHVPPPSPPGGGFGGVFLGCYGPSDLPLYKLGPFPSTSFFMPLSSIDIALSRFAGVFC